MARIASGAYRRASNSGSVELRVRSLPLHEWPAKDRLAWASACRPEQRLRRGGAASRMKTITRDDLARRYGYFLSHIENTGGLDLIAEASAYVTRANVESYLTDLRARVNSVTVYSSIYKMRRAAQLIAPDRDLTWLIEIEKDLALVMQPRSKLDRLVSTKILIEAGMTLMQEAETAKRRSPLARARQFRDGLMVALLAACPIRLKNFSMLEIGRTFMSVNGSWWIVLPASETKEYRADERAVPDFLTQWVDYYLATHRPVLARIDDAPASLWLSSNDGSALTYLSVEKIISHATLATVGIDVSPHLFRTAAASTAASHGGQSPHLASALLHHTHPAVTEEHYNRASSFTAAQTYANLIKSYRHGD